jgi:superfamily II DNA or RNA helicase
MVTILDIIKDANSWSNIYANLVQYNSAGAQQAGKLFEEFCRLYYLTEPSVRQEYRNVWLFSEAPLHVKTKLNLGKIDHGIDLIMEDNFGSFSVVQCKFKNDQSINVSWTKDRIANFFADGDKADYLIVFTNGSGLDQYSLFKKATQLKLVTVGDLVNISQAVIDEMRELLLGSIPAIHEYKKPRGYQLTAINEVAKGFSDSNRGQLILPCGAGKTLVSLWIKETLKPKHTLVLVPSLALLRQIKNEWSANSNFVPYLCVCSEKDIDKGQDTVATHTYDIKGRVTTNAYEIKDFLSKNDNTIIYSTYQSLEAICAAIKSTDFTFDLAICDEAHKTSGSKLGSFALVHSDSNLPVKKRLYMTATPRVISGELKNSLNEEQLKYLHEMDDPSIFGKVFYRMSFKQAIDQGILVDYQIVSIGISNQELEEAIKERKFVNDNETIDEIANNYALEKFMQKYGATHVITFHSSISKAKGFKKRHKEIYPEVDIEHVNGTLTTNERNKLLKEFADTPKAIITNSRCLTEGIDVPAIDAVYFCDPKNSKIDIVQATGRALRRADDKEKKMGYIIVPIFHSEKDKLEEIVDSGAFSNLISVIKALYSHDERLVDEIRSLKLGKGERVAQSNRLEISGLRELITLENFKEELKEKLFDQVISKLRVPWRSFEEARAFIHTLGIKNDNGWREYCKNGDRPTDIPSNPDGVYMNSGWISMGDWLGTGRIADQKRLYRAFREAREFARSLNLKNEMEWRIYSKSGLKPDDIPAYPSQTYKDNGWISIGDWLGTKREANRNRKYRSFFEARDFVRALGLASASDWRDYSKSGQKPKDIPSSPHKNYENKGWVSWGDWLGNNPNFRRKKEYLPFNEAKIYVHSLGIKNGKEWIAYCKSGEKIQNIPCNPRNVYKKEWISLGDWLGTGKIANFRKVYRSYKEAQLFAKSLNLKSQTEWYAYCKKVVKPNDIPSCPNQTYKNEGWVSWGSWLGNNIIASQNKKYLPFNEARKYAHSLALKSSIEWKVFWKTHKPDNIPAKPYRTYENNGWISWGDWLGTGRVSNSKKNFRSWEKAREFTKSLNLKTKGDWLAYCKCGAKPDDIPAYPHQTYKDKGWLSMGDWLGTGRIAAQKKEYRTIEEAKKFIHTLSLKSRTEWRSYCKSGIKPDDIPSCPNKTYRGKGWISWKDWLGTKKEFRGHWRDTNQ